MAWGVQSTGRRHHRWMGRGAAASSNAAQRQTDPNPHSGHGALHHGQYSIYTRAGMEKHGTRLHRQRARSPGSGPLLRHTSSHKNPGLPVDDARGTSRVCYTGPSHACVSSRHKNRPLTGGRTKGTVPLLRTAHGMLQRSPCATNEQHKQSYEGGQVRFGARAGS